MRPLLFIWQLTAACLIALASSNASALTFEASVTPRCAAFYDRVKASYPVLERKEVADADGYVSIRLGMPEGVRGKVKTADVEIGYSCRKKTSKLIGVSDNPQLIINVDYNGTRAFPRPDAAMMNAMGELVAAAAGVTAADGLKRVQACFAAAKPEPAGGAKKWAADYEDIAGFSFGCVTVHGGGIPYSSFGIHINGGFNFSKLKP